MPAPTYRWVVSNREQRSRRALLRSAGGVGVAVLAGCTGGADGASGDGGSGGSGTDGGSGDGGGTPSERGGTTTRAALSGTMTVFHAGSLAPPFTATEEALEEDTVVQVNREAKGSVASTKKITDQGRSADVLGVSDYRLIRDVVLPEFGSWYAIFATNAMTIAYTDGSTGADEIGPDNWWEVLTRDDVKFAHSDPAVDPNGYRTEMTMQLGAVEFEGETLYDGTTADALIEQSIVPSGTETDLIGQLQSGALDYAWNYQSAGASYDVRTIDLQPSVDLSQATAKYADHYANAEVEAGGNTYTGAPIAYGIAVPSVAEHPEAGAAWVEYMITEPGRGIMSDNGFEPVAPAVVPASAESEVPGNVVAHAEAKSSLGPLSL